jgi:hypothetical protein
VAKKSFTEKMANKVEQEVTKGIPLSTVLKHNKLGLIPVGNGIEFRMHMVLSRGLRFLNDVGMLYVKNPDLIIQPVMKRYFDNLRAVNEGLSQLAELYYSEEFKEIREKIFERGDKTDSGKIEDDQNDGEIIKESDKQFDASEEEKEKIEEENTKNTSKLNEISMEV